MDNIERALNDPSPHTRATAVKELGKLTDPRAVALILPMLEDSNKQVRVEAVAALGNLGDEKAIEPLIALWRREQKRAQEFPTSEDAEPYTVHPGLISLVLRQQFGARAVDALIANIDLFGVIFVLGEIGDPRSVDALVAVLAQPHIGFQHTGAVIALGKIGDPRAIPTLERFLSVRIPSLEIDTLAHEAIQNIQQR
jgi:hypothetical protein